MKRFYAKHEPASRRHKALALCNAKRCRLSRQIRSANLTSGGDRRDRTDDLMLAKQLLSQLSYVPKLDKPDINTDGTSQNRQRSARASSRLCKFQGICYGSFHTIAAGNWWVVGLERFELSTSRLSSARSNQLSYRPITACKASTRLAEPSRHVRCHLKSDPT
jgi:hypothetical protein